MPKPWPFPPRTHIAKASKPPRIHLAKPSKKRLNSKCYQKYEKPNRFQRYDWALRIFPKRGRKKTQNRNVAMRQEKLIYSLFLTHRNVTILCFFATPLRENAQSPIVTLKTALRFGFFCDTS